MSLSSNSGSAELAGLPLGKYRFRLADLSGRRVLAQQVAGIAVFGEVPFSTLFGSTGGVHATPKYSFPYVASWEFGGSPAFKVEHNHCNFVHIAFVGSSWLSKGETGILTLTLVQESREPTTASAHTETIGGLDANLVPGQTWAVNMSGDAEEPIFYINGYAICDSVEPFSS